jgi:hypothetical protein
MYLRKKFVRIENSHYLISEGHLRPGIHGYRVLDHRKFNRCVELFPQTPYLDPYPQTPPEAPPNVADLDYSPYMMI